MPPPETKKRKRTLATESDLEDAGGQDSTPRRSSKFWFEDANIVLQTETFSSAFTKESSASLVAGCAVVILQDTAENIRNLLALLYSIMKVYGLLEKKFLGLCCWGGSTSCVLAICSAIFKDTFTASQPEDRPLIEDCLVAFHHNRVIDLDHILGLLYRSFRNYEFPSPLPFSLVAAMYRLGKKY
ncbi:unnamed protein product [Cyclocybe aegerita]|uniref:Uncharacterized protein n=1 Tax=Cyclocybe aegerita TaxID=1973307 RepID=A0A8S0XUF3_CYCAE|nr:unnamed protein product [Cyclocybe aegerita]